MQISHEAIYRSLFIQTRGVLKKELMAQLRTARRMRRPKNHNAKSGQGHILDMVSIRERPAEIEDRAVPGHWEGDLLTGANDTHIATLVELPTYQLITSAPPEKAPYSGRRGLAALCQQAHAPQQFHICRLLPGPVMVLTNTQASRLLA
jgi:IS30 family transposase